MNVWPRWIACVAMGASLLGAVRSAHAQDAGLNCQSPTDPIVAENCLPGSPHWRPAVFSNAILGYASATSVAAGDELTFYVDTESPTFDLAIFRLGYYAGAGARQVASQPDVKGGSQPYCHEDATTGLISCENWRPSFKITVPADWPAGVYFARFTTGSASNGTIFVIRDDSPADLIVQIPVTTYQAVNAYGGKSTDDPTSGVCTVPASGKARAVAVSFDRPYDESLSGPDGFLQNDMLWVQWLESQGYRVSYATSLDVHDWGKEGVENRLLAYKAFLSIGDDAYWSQEMWNAVTQARDAGVHLGFFSGSTARWRIRLDPSATGVDDRVLVSYKTIETGRTDPSGIPTSAWRDPGQMGLPENQLVGSYYTGRNAGLSFPLRVSGDMARDRIYRHTGLQTLPAGSVAAVGTQIVGPEWNSVTDSRLNPLGLAILAESPVAGALLTDAGDDDSARLGPAFAHMTRYVAPSGALVFAAGTAQWGWGLAGHEPNPLLRQITYNILADMGVAPLTPAATLIVDGSNVPDPPLPVSYVPTEPPQIQHVAIEPGLLSAIIRWQTATPTRGQVFYGDTSETIRIAAPAEAEATTQHRVVVEHLTPGTDYFAQALSIADDGGVSFSSVLGFETQASPPERVMADWGAAQWTSLGCLAAPLTDPASAALHDHPILSALVLIVVSLVALIAAAALFRARRAQLRRHTRQRPVRAERPSRAR